MRAGWAGLSWPWWPWPRPGSAVAASAQTSHTPRSPRPGASGSPAAAPASPAPITVPGYVVTLEIRATAPGLTPSPSAAPEAQALASRLKGTSSLRSRVWLAQDLSRQEILSTDSVLPAGTLVMHKAGDRLYVIADPQQRTYVVMDSQALLEALEGSGGVVNTQYEARVQHTDERKVIAGLPCRKSVLVVSYISSIPLENDRVSRAAEKRRRGLAHVGPRLLRRPRSALLQVPAGPHRRRAEGRRVRDRLPDGGRLRRHPGRRAEGAVPAPGSLHMEVTEVRREPRLDAELFRIPPAGYRRTDKNVYFATGAR